MSEQTRFHPDAIRRYAGKTVLVVGAARSGLAAAELLLALGAQVILNDSKTQSELGPLPEVLLQPGCSLRLGEAAGPLLSACDMLLISPGIPLETPFVQAAASRGIPVIGELGFAASCARQRLIAVSGTNGKTTTVSLLGEIFSQAGYLAHVAGNIGYPLSAAVLKAKPEDILIAEVSSFQLETAPDFHPQAAALLNISPDHLDRHHSMEAYIALKMRLFAQQSEQDIAVLNADDPQLAAMAAHLQGQVTWFSRAGTGSEGALLKEGKLVWQEEGQTRVLCEATDLKIPGAHNIENALAAAAIACRMQVPPPVVAYALKTFAGVEHRIEFVAKSAGVRWLNDSKGTNPDSTVKAVESMLSPTVLIAGGYDKQVPFDALAAAIVHSGQIHHVVLLGQTAQKISQALQQAGFGSIHLADSLDQAVLTAACLAQPGHTVLFSPACASFDMFHDYEERGRAFKALVAQLKREEA